MADKGTGTGGNGGRLTQFIAASGLTNLGDGVAMIAWTWTASLLTRDPLLIALVAVAQRLPWAVLALPAGLTADRVDRRQLILAMDLLRALAFAGLALALWLALPAAPPATGLGSLPAYLALVLAALIVGGAEVFRDNAAQTMLPALVPHDRLEAANGRLWSVELTGNALVGPPIGAALLALALPLPFAINALAYACAALIIARLAGSYQPRRSAGGCGSRHWRDALAEGISFLRDAPLLRLLALLTGFWNLFLQMVMVALVLHAQESLHLSPSAYGLILGVGALGGIAGGLCGERIVRWLGPGPTAQWMLLASAPAFLGMALAPNGWVLAGVLLVFEFSGLVWNTVSVATRQRMIPDHLLGRVNSVYRLLAWGMMPIGMLLSGVTVRVAERLWDRESALLAPFWIAAMGVFVLAFVGWRALGKGLGGTR